MSIGTIILIILVIALLGGFSGIGGGPFYGTGLLRRRRSRPGRHHPSDLVIDGPSLGTRSAFTGRNRLRWLRRSRRSQRNSLCVCFTIGGWHSDTAGSSLRARRWIIFQLAISNQQLGYALGFVGVVMFGATLPATKLAVPAMDLYS